VLLLLEISIGSLFVSVVITQLIYPIIKGKTIFPIFNKNIRDLNKMIKSIDEIKEEKELINKLETKIKEIKNG